VFTKSQHVSRQLLCKTLAGNRVDLLTITDNTATQAQINKRKGVVLTARIHPGESNSSFVMKGILDFLTSEDNAEADLLRKNFVFKIVPMINVDGVIYGNYRTSLAGIDLNRTWKRPNPVLFPEVTAIKKVVDNFNT
jgi:murein tripeptide amidase MpaA